MPRLIVDVVQFPQGKLPRLQIVDAPSGLAITQLLEPKVADEIGRQLQAAALKSKQKIDLVHTIES